MFVDIAKIIPFCIEAEYEKNEGQTAQAVVGPDETFFDKMIPVMIELGSGYILLEEPAEVRMEIRPVRCQASFDDRTGRSGPALGRHPLIPGRELPQPAQTTQ